MKLITKIFIAFFILFAIFITNINNVHAQIDSNLDTVIVIGQLYDKFGNRITEQSYYRTGGDVTVIDRKDIENNHYQNITEAIKSVPGVQVSGTGHNANVVGMTGSGPNYANELSINGDTNVVILIDGIRIGNEAMDVGGLGGGARVMLNMITAIDYVENIEVIKGASASIYGADATGGVINIITRKGATEPSTAIKLAGGSFHSYNISAFHSGSTKDNKTRYFFGINRERNGNTDYKDGITGKTENFLNTHYRADAIIFRLDRELTQQQSLSFSYTHTNSLAGNPTTAPEYSTMYRLWNGDLYADRALSYYNPGYRNWFYLGALYNNYVKTQNNQYTFQYVFHKDNNIPSFIRLYVERSRIGVMDYAGNGGLMNKPPSIYMNETAIQNILKKRHPIRNYLNNLSIDFQFAKKLSRHNLILGMQYRKNDYRWIRVNNNGNDGSFDVTGITEIDSKRDIFYAWIQDTIEINDQLTIAPGLRYSYYSHIRSNYDGQNRNYESTRQLTYDLQSNFMFNSSTSMYFSVSSVFRPVTYMEFDSETPLERLRDEKGLNWSLGFNKRFSDTTIIDINFSYLDMSNAIGRYPVWNEATSTTTTRSVNAKQKKRAFNIAINHEFNENWQIRASYSYVSDKFKAKNWQIIPVVNGTTIDDMINSYRPRNIYQLDLSYSYKDLNIDLTSELLSGLDSRYFTDTSFFIMGVNVNYRIKPQINLFLKVDNITNEAYETKARNFFGKGAYPQPGRSFMLGTQFNF
ncbi:MAG: TonB-dependent receptor [Deltaproteobacteria bacterium]|jgi:iron complex outermembrane receptor protein|nr:TonB-dependent receptor [Deltaproteobacteria bacterium]